MSTAQSPHVDALRRTAASGDASKADGIVRDLAQLIVSGQLATGGLLASENELSRHYGVSRPNIRIALRRLSTAGLAETHHGIGTFVSGREKWNLFDPMLLNALLQADDLSAIAEELVELRKMVEVECCGLAATRIDERGLQQLEQSVQQMGDALDDVARITRIDLAFHDVIVGACQNRFLRGIISYVREPLERARLLTMQAGGTEGRARAHHSHRAIYEALAARDVDGARTAMTEHMRQLEKDMRIALQTRPERRAHDR